MRPYIGQGAGEDGGRGGLLEEGDMTSAQERTYQLECQSVHVGQGQYGQVGRAGLHQLAEILLESVVVA